MGKLEKICDATEFLDDVDSAAVDGIEKVTTGIVRAMERIATSYTMPSVIYRPTISEGMNTWKVSYGALSVFGDTPRPSNAQL